MHICKLHKLHDKDFVVHGMKCTRKAKDEEHGNKYMAIAKDTEITIKAEILRKRKK